VAARTELGRRMWSGSSPWAMHLRVGVSSWDRKTLTHPACYGGGLLSPRMTSSPLEVTCADCRMADAFREARAELRALRAASRAQGSR